MSTIAAKNLRDDPHGRHADTPGDIPLKGLRDVAWRVFEQVLSDRVTLIAAGATYYIVLSIFPAMGVLVSLYGFVSDPAELAKQIGFLSGVLPPGAFDLLVPQLSALAEQDHSTLSLAFFVSLIIAFWSANSGIKALFEAMNVAYGEAEKRSIVWLNLLSFGFTFGVLVVAIALIIAIGIVPAILSYLYLDKWAQKLALVAPWPFLLLIMGVATAILYRYGPSREDAKLRWITWGVVFSTVLWGLSTILFSYYLANFANYNATYGTLGAMIGFMGWIWISIVILIVGAELNAELEHQTICDSTTGVPLPMGERGAVMADTLGKIAD